MCALVMRGYASLCWGGCIMVKALDCEILLSKIEIQFCYHVHFRKINLQKGKNSIIFQVID